mgnify:CR=1 FL=1
MNQKPLLKSNATIYRQEVANVCLNCPYEKCVNPNQGCDLFKAHWTIAVKESARKGWNPKQKEV